MNAAQVAVKSNGHVVIIPGEGEFLDFEDEKTNPFITLDEKKEEQADNWVDGMTLFALALTVFALICLCASGHP